LPYRTRQEVPPVVRPPAGGTIPPLPRPDVLPPAAMALILELAARQGGSRLGVTPSLYLHLGLWPAAVSAAHAQIMPLLDSPAWPVRLTRLLSSTDVLAGEIAGSLSATLPPPEPDILQPLLDTVAIFVKATIPEMVLIGRMLARPDA